MVLTASLLALYAAALATATPSHRRAVDQLNEEATQEAQQRDDTAIRAFSDVQIKTSDGRCLFVDQLSGDFRANLTPVQIADCGSTDGQGWDIITSGKHNDQPGQMLVVSTLTQACLNFDPRRNAGNQLLLFSCGGRADGGGAVTDSQLFAFDGSASTVSLSPLSGENICATSSGQVLDVANCAQGAQDQVFTFGNGGDNAVDNGNNGGNTNQTAPGNNAQPGGQYEIYNEKRWGGGRWSAKGRGGRGRGRGKKGHKNGNGAGAGAGGGYGWPSYPQYPPPNGGGAGGEAPPAATSVSSAAATTPVASEVGEEVPPTTIASSAAVTTSAAGEDVTITTPLAPVATGDGNASDTTTEGGSEVAESTSAGNAESSAGGAVTTSATKGPAGALPTVNPTDPVPVSRAGGTLNPTAAAEAHKFDKTAVRTKQSVNIRAADGRCLSVDPTAGDFRQNLIPVAMLECADVTSQKFDIVTSGLHNNAEGKALLVSVMTDGCVSFDPRREEGDKVTVFSCGGRADGGGETDSAQLFPFDGSDNMVLEPQSGRGASCLVAGTERLDAANCDQSDDQKYEIVEVL